MTAPAEPAAAALDERELYDLIVRIGRLLQAGERAAGAPLLPVQLHALDFLERANRYSNTPRAVGEYLGVTKGTASQTLLALEKRGLLERRTDQGDRRVQRLKVTPEGRRTLRAALPPPEFEAAVAMLGSGASRLAEGWTELLRALQHSHGSRAFGVCRTCRHFRARQRGGALCGLTGEALRKPETELICREHERVDPDD